MGKSSRVTTEPNGLFVMYGPSGKTWQTFVTNRHGDTVGWINFHETEAKAKAYAETLCKKFGATMPYLIEG